jgi:hypothetical protein
MKTLDHIEEKTAVWKALLKTRKATISTLSQMTGLPPRTIEKVLKIFKITGLARKDGRSFVILGTKLSQEAKEAGLSKTYRMHKIVSAGKGPKMPKELDTWFYAECTICHEKTPYRTLGADTLKGWDISTWVCPNH